MEKYIVQGTKSTPFVELDFDKQVLSFKGKSYPENAYTFYEPIYKWVDEYLDKSIKNETIVEFFMSYVNTSSTKCLIILLDKINKAYLKDMRITVNWYFDDENGFDYEMGKDFSEDIDVPFNFISVKN